MQFLKFIIFAVILGVTPFAKALVLSDVREFNAPLVYGEYGGFTFNLADHGYNHLTDTITRLKLSFDFREIVDTEEDYENPGDMSAFEFVIFYSHIFDGRAVYADIETGTVTFELAWEKRYACQYFTYVDNEEMCWTNLDLTGVMTSSFEPYTDNLWLGEARLDAEITRISVPEPASILLLVLGLFGLGMQHKRRLISCLLVKVNVYRQGHFTKK